MNYTNEIELRPGERVIRSDLAAFWGTIGNSFWPNPPRRETSEIPHLTEMIVTTERLIFCRVASAGRGRFMTWLILIPIVNIITMLFVGPAPLGETEAFEFTQIDSVHGWSPELSGPPMLQIGNNGVFFRLHITPRKIAPLQARSEHFHAVRDAWETRRSKTSD